MPTNELPPIPQTGIPPLALSDDQEQKLLNRRRKADHTDPFASDPNDEVRRLGRLALRRDVLHQYDYLALGDLCAQLSLVESDRRLRVFPMKVELPLLNPSSRPQRTRKGVSSGSAAGMTG